MREKIELETAVQLLTTGEYAKAFSKAKPLLRSSPKSETLLSICSTCSIHLGEFSLAAKYLSMLTKIVPREASHWSRLGYVQFVTGDFKRAQFAYSRAASLEPSEPDHVLNHALCKVANKDLDAAAKSFSQALTLEPENPRALQGYANVRREQSRPFEAMPYLQLLSEVAGTRDPEFWIDYAEAALAISDIPETRNAIAKARACMPGNESVEADREARIASLLSRMGDTDEALQAADRVIDIAPGQPEILNDVANVYIDSNRFDAASKVYFNIIEDWPDFSPAYFWLCQLRKFQSGSPDDMALLETLEQAQKIEQTDLALLQFALGKVFADLNDAERAMQHLHKANALRKRERPYSLQPDLARVGNLKKQFPAGSIAASSKPVRNDTLSPIFVVGMPRSGTTLVEQIISAHPQVTACGEQMLLPYILASYMQEECAVGGPAWQEIGSLYLKHISGLAAGRMRTTDKLPANLFNVGAIWTALPDAKVILLERDPMDVGLSCYQTAFSPGLDFSYDLKQIGQFQRLCDDICDHWQSLAPSRLLKIGYEDLVTNLDIGTRSILDHCELEWHPDCERYFEKQRRIGTASFNQANQPAYVSSVGKWRRYENHLKPLASALH